MQDPKNSENSNHKPSVQRKSHEEDREKLGMTKTKNVSTGMVCHSVLKMKSKAYHCNYMDQIAPNN